MSLSPSLSAYKGPATIEKGTILSPQFAEGTKKKIRAILNAGLDNVCMYVMYVCMYVCMYVMYVCMYVMYVCMYVCMYELAIRVCSIQKD